MLAPERQQQILTLLEERGTLRTIDLAEEFQVTDETIRRDFQVLAEKGHLTRIHGGASAVSDRTSLRSFTERRLINVEKKQAIARCALDSIHPGRTYAFDSSTTVFELVASLPDLACRVVTNAYAMIDRLVGYEHIDLICTGGRYHPKTQTFVGGESIDALRRHNIHTAFISCISVDLVRGASEGFEEQATFKERLIEASEKVVLLVDSGKFRARSEYFFAGFHQINQIITDGGIEPEVVERLRNQGVHVTIA
ncbi:MAG: DeoR/GlpR family DNA-binding transcription regulator [Verrucomicrobiota bacterium]